MANAGGRPTDYRTSYNKQAEKLCKLGATDKDLAEFFEVSKSTLNLWKKNFPKFSDSIKKGKKIADANVAEALYQRAIGYSHKAVKILVVDKKVQEVPYIEHFPPETLAIIYWLKNRQKEMWRDKQEVDHTSGGKPIQFGVVSYKDAMEKMEKENVKGGE